MSHTDSSRHDDVLTLIAVALLTYVASMMAHEAIGHGAACLAAGGRVVTLWALDLRCALDASMPPDPVRRFMAAAGPVVPLLIGLLLWADLRGERDQGWGNGRTGSLRFTVQWLLSVFLILPNVGYFCLAVAAKGDWAIALNGTPWALRAAVAAAGVALYWALSRSAFRTLREAYGCEAWPRGRRLAWVAYVTANLAAAGAAAHQAGATSALGLSGWGAAGASLAGTSGLAWGVVALRRPPRGPSVAIGIVGRSWGMIALSAIAAAFFVAVLAPGLRLA